MPDPKDKKAVLRFLGMVNFLSPFIPNKASITEPLRQLIKDNATWNRGRPQQQALVNLKRILGSEILLKFYDEQEPLTIQADASNTGLGACLLQNNQTICYASRPLTSTEIRYAQIEKDMLAILFAAQRFHHYIYGVEVVVHSDHKPLVYFQERPQ